MQWYKTKESTPARTKLRSIHPLDGPDIAMGQSGLTAEQPSTVGDLMKMTVTKIPNGIALRHKIGDTSTWNDITYQEYYNMCISAAKSFIKV